MEDGLEKRNVIEDGRTPVEGIKIAEEVEKTAAELNFNIKDNKETESDEQQSDKDSG